MREQRSLLVLYPVDVISNFLISVIRQIGSPWFVNPGRRYRRLELVVDLLEELRGRGVGVRGRLRKVSF